MALKVHQKFPPRPVLFHGYGWFFPIKVRDGTNMTTTIFELISKDPIVQFWGTPGWCILCPFYTVEHRKKNAEILDLMCHQMPFWCDIRCKTFLENYSCGCVWAVPDKVLCVCMCRRSFWRKTKVLFFRVWSLGMPALYVLTCWQLGWISTDFWRNRPDHLPTTCIEPACTRSDPQKYYWLRCAFPWPLSSQKTREGCGYFRVSEKHSRKIPGK